MQRGTSRKFAVIALGLMTVALLVVGGIILFQIMQNQQPNDADAFGFGSSANREYIKKVGIALSATSCDAFIDNRNVGQLKTGKAILTSYEVTDYNISPLSLISCNYYLGEGDIINFSLLTYDPESDLPESQDELFLDVNVLTIGPIYEKNKYVYSGGDYFNITHFFGPTVAKNQGEIDPNYDYTNADQCSSVIYHNWNDFAYGVITYNGLATCETFSAATDSFVANVSERTMNILDNIYKDNGLTEEDYKTILKEYNIPI